MYIHKEEVISAMPGNLMAFANANSDAGWEIVSYTAVNVSKSPLDVAPPLPGWSVLLRRIKEATLPEVEA